MTNPVMQIRIEGTLTKWDDDRGFGFIVSPTSAS